MNTRPFAEEGSPAGGILWRPNPQTYFDIYFPKPKLAQYLYTVGNTDVWWYLNGEIGGGSWTIERGQVVAGQLSVPQPPPNPPVIVPGGPTFTPVVGDRRVDLNDYRIGGGFEKAPAHVLRFDAVSSKKVGIQSNEQFTLGAAFDDDVGEAG